MFDVDFYTDRSGEKPFEKFIKELQEKGKTSKADRIRVNKILAYISVLEKKGTRAGKPYVDHIEGDIWELRPLQDRVFFFFWKDNTFILLHHFLKKTRKTPKIEIEQAKRNMNDYLERNEKDE